MKKSSLGAGTDAARAGANSHSAKKRRTPLQALWKSVKVWSCADGRIRITPEWQPEYKPVGGVLTRMYAAAMVEDVIHGR